MSQAREALNQVIIIYFPLYINYNIVHFLELSARPHLPSSSSMHSNTSGGTVSFNPNLLTNFFGTLLNEVIMNVPKEYMKIDINIPQGANSSS